MPEVAPVVLSLRGGQDEAGQPLLGIDDALFLWTMLWGAGVQKAGPTAAPSTL